MVGLMATESRERVANLLDSINFASTIPSKLRYLHELKAEFSSSDVILLSEFLTGLLKLLSDQFSPVRKFVAEMVGEVGSSHFELLPEIVPALMTVFDDDAPAVSRQAISSATDIFLSTLEKVALQGLSTSELDDSLQEAWAWMTKMKGRLYSIAFQSGSDGRRVLSLKFVKSVILIYTPDPSGSSEPPIVQANEGKPVEINMSWLRKGHPLLNVGDLSVEASERLRLLVDQLRTPTVKSLSVSMMIVLVNSLSVVATKRPSFYGRILPVLLGLDASSSVIKGFHAYGLQNALKNAFLSCLKCTYSSARPWRDRLVGALKEMKAGELADLAVEEICSVNGKVKEEEIDFPITQEEPSPTMTESVQLSKGRKRSGDQQFGETSEDDDTPGKRFKSTPLVEGSPRLSNTRVVDEGATSSVQPIVRAEDDSGPAQQLVALFGALVAQGEKAAAHLDILIASIATDMLAEVVIANMKHLPSACPNAEADDEASTSSGSCPSLLESDSRFRQLSLFLSNAISAASPQKSSEMDVQQPSSHDMKEHYVKEEPLEVVADEHDGVNVLMDESVDRTLASSLPLPSDVGGFSEVGKGFSSLTVGFQDVENTNAGIPGLDNASNDVLPGLETSTSLVATDLDDGSQDLDTSLVKISKIESLPSVSTDRSEESCAKAVVADANSGVASTATSLRSIQQFVLPKVAAPVIDLTDEEKDEIQKVSFARIVKAYKQVAISGGSHLHFSLLACLGVEFPLDLDPWAIIQEHILSDYVNHEGHELTLLVLYKLYKEAEERDFFSSTTATSVYEMFLLKVAETLRDSFPSSDKSLSRLLGEVPYLPKTIFDLLEGLCCPDIKGKDDKESQIGDRVTQGLSTVWSLILSRPPLRDVLLKIALQSAVYHVEEVRMKAIRLVANKLYPLSSISIQIEDFAKNMLDSVVKEQATTVDAEKSSNQSQKNCDNAPHSSEDPSSDAPKDISNAHQAYTSKDTPNMLISEARKCMSLYFALCTKKHSLLRQMFIIYKISPAYVKQTIHSQMPILIRTIGASPMVLEIISNPPEGSESLLMEVLHTLTDGALPSPQLINAVKCFYESKKKDVEILFPILSFLPKEEVVQIFPSLVNLPAERFQAALPRLLQGSAPSGPILTPEEVLIAIHGIDPDKDRIPLKKVTEACNACFEQRQIFTQQVLAKVLNQLVEQIPLPLLFMRTVLQAVGAFPALVDFIMGILSRLVNKQIWKFPKLWVGFLKCAQLTQPHSFNVLLQVPSAQLEGALNKIPALKAPLVGHASQPEVRTTLTRSTLVVLGLVTESSQNVSPAQAVAPSETTDGGGSEKESTTERSKESSSN